MSENIVGWIGSPKKAHFVPVPDFGLGLYDGMIGQPPSTCPTPVSADAQGAFKKCRDAAYAKAVASCANYPGDKSECIQPNFYANFNQSNCFQHCAEKCTAAGPIKAAQDALGRTPTGVWTDLDQQAMLAQGLTFQDVAPGCTGLAPTPVATTSPAPKACPAGQTLDPATGACVPTPTTGKKSSTWGVVALAGAALVGVVIATTS